MVIALLPWRSAFSLQEGQKLGMPMAGGHRRLENTETFKRTACVPETSLTCRRRASRNRDSDLL
ncbi:hypothetical protein EYF80_064451 [Liparis tanakae]|uniref:Uncharacterized protein n=1 Tax=Liparis tanakae TaxID=230148 RepID=A0A4Z2EA44_9TELE|nr:hypothetical protein EYF80_064451 [Liparis tanakae]